MTSDFSKRQDDTTARSERHHIGELEWHPLVGALLWIFRWCVFSLFLAVLWEFAAGRQLQLNFVVARGVWLLLAVGLLAPVLLVFELWWALVSHGRKNYDRSFSNGLTITYTMIMILILTPYFFVFAWLLNFMWPYLGGLLTGPVEAVTHDGTITWIEWLAVPICMALVMRLIPSGIRTLIIDYTEAMGGCWASGAPHSAAF
jgi:hypothetical protein